MTSYYHSIAAMVLSRTVSEINGDFGQYISFPTRVFNAPLLRFPLEFGNTGWAKETRPRKKFNDIFSRLDTIHECD